MTSWRLRQKDIYPADCLPPFWSIILRVPLLGRLQRYAHQQLLISWTSLTLTAFILRIPPPPLHDNESLTLPSFSQPSFRFKVGSSAESDITWAYSRGRLYLLVVVGAMAEAEDCCYILQCHLISSMTFQLFRSKGAGRVGSISAPPKRLIVAGSRSHSASYS